MNFADVFRLVADPACCIGWQRRSSGIDLIFLLIHCVIGVCVLYEQIRDALNGMLQKDRYCWPAYM